MHLRVNWARIASDTRQILSYAVYTVREETSVARVSTINSNATALYSRRLETEK